MTESALGEAFDRVFSLAEEKIKQALDGADTPEVALDCDRAFAQLRAVKDAAPVLLDLYATAVLGEVEADDLSAFTDRVSHVEAELEGYEASPPDEPRSAYCICCSKTLTDDNAPKLGMLCYNCGGRDA